MSATFDIVDIRANMLSVSRPLRPWVRKVERMNVAAGSMAKSVADTLTVA